MTDKERILMKIISRVIPGLALSYSVDKNSKYVELGGIFSEVTLNSGDLVIASTTIVPNDFIVGFVDEVQSDCVVIREIGSKRKTNYYNESFHKINKECIGYEILEGVQHQIYIKVLKAFDKYGGYWNRFKSIKFDGDVCIVQARESFSNDYKFEFQFDYDSKTTIKKIGLLLNEKIKEVDEREG